ncbi:MAG: riboflavin synthase [Ignavibacteria bacterium]|jgi:riboflavin synthase
MFSGIVEEQGVITKKIKIPEGFKFRVKAKKVSKGLKKADSVSINGVCHTITKKLKNEFEFVSMHETLKKTNIGGLDLKVKVNLERSLRIGGEIGGHFVFGHIDDTGIITDIKQIRDETNPGKESDNWEYFIRIDKKYAPYVIYVGSIAVDGVSLTVAEVHPVTGDHFDIKVAIIPYTYKNTRFNEYKVNDIVNIEFDFLGKYVQKILENRPEIKQNLT